MFFKSKSRFSVISPYSAAIHGASRAPAARSLPQVPFEFWLATRNAVAPFRDSCLVVGNDHDVADVANFTKSAKEHFKNVVDFSFPLEVFVNSNHANQNQREMIAGSSAGKGDLVATSKNAKNDAEIQIENAKLVYALNSKVKTFLSASLSPNSSAAELQRNNIKNSSLLDVVILSPSCTSSASSLVEDFDKNQKMVKSGKTKKSKLISSPQDLHFAFQSFAPLLKPHGILCLTGTDILSSSQILCGGGEAAKETRQDWRDLCDFLKSRSTNEETYLDLVSPEINENVNQKKDDDDDEDSVFDYDRFAEIRTISHSFGLTNTTYFEFETEYSLDDNFQFLSGIVRRIPAYRRMVSNDLTTEKFGDDKEEIFSFRRGEKNSLEQDHKITKSTDVIDPLECFLNLAKMRNMDRGHVVSPENSNSKNSSKLMMRIKLKHWMWVCDKRPRSKDSISFASRSNKK